MTLKERAVEVVARLEHGDAEHRRWLREVATPLILDALRAARREAFAEAALERGMSGSFW